MASRSKKYVKPAVDDDKFEVTMNVVVTKGGKPFCKQVTTYYNMGESAFLFLEKNYVDFQANMNIQAREAAQE